MAFVTSTDRPKSVRNRCVIEVFVRVFVLSNGCCILSWYKGFRHRTESDLVLFLSSQWVFLIVFKVLRPSGPNYWKMMNGYLMFFIKNIVQNVKLIELWGENLVPLHFGISKS